MNTKEILRWMGLLPCALIGAIFATILVCIMCLIGDILDGSFWSCLNHPEIFYYEHFFTPFITTAVFCGVFVHTGGRIAPKFKRQIAFSLSIVIAILLTVLAFFSVLMHEWRCFAQCVFGIIVAVATAYNWPLDINTNDPI